MTYEELKTVLATLDKDINALYKQKGVLRSNYAEEHAPLKLKTYQRIIIHLRVTEKHNQMLYDKYKKMRKYQPGYEYHVIGFFTGWFIEDDGSVKPCLYGNAEYSRYDEILSIELCKEQLQGDCKKCRCYKDGYCYMMGGKDLGVSCANHKVEEGDCVCPHYEEMTELWDSEGHYPHVTKVWKNNKFFYRIYNKDWTVFSEYTEEEIKKFYLFEPL